MKSTIALRPLPVILSSLGCALAAASMNLFEPAVLDARAIAETAPLRATEPAARPMPAPKPAAAALTEGKVLETMDAATYTYARVQTDSGEKWVAGPRTALKVGDAIAWPGGAEMKNFPSKTLGRTFESILFVDRILVGGAAAAGAAAGAGSGTAAAAGSAGEGASPHANLGSKAEAEAEITGIEKAEGGQTVAEIYDGRAALEGKEVVVRGKVVKFNAGVMDRNWIHLRDGSRGKDGDNDLTVTSTGSAAVGDTVVVRGRLTLGKDFGFGYRYEVLVEGASVVVDQ